MNTRTKRLKFYFLYVLNLTILFAVNGANTFNPHPPHQSMHNAVSFQSRFTHGNKIANDNVKRLCLIYI